MQHPDTRSDERLLKFVLGPGSWRKAGPKALVRALHDVGQIEKDEIPSKPSDMTPELLEKLQNRYKAVMELPLIRYAGHLKPALFRRIHVGTMDLMDASHEGYRRAFDFIEVTNSWHDTDLPWRSVPARMKEDMGCGYKPPSYYDALAKRARDGFKMVVKVSHVATHMRQLDKFEEWWPMLYKEKYSKLGFATVAYLWQFPPSFRYERHNWEALEQLAEYLHSSDSGASEARHIVDFRHSSWYNADTYQMLRRKRWCLAWLHVNNDNGWASDLPSGWTDRVRTTDFIYMRLFGSQGATHGRYNNVFLHEVFDSCPAGATSYVTFGAMEELDNKNPEPRPALVDAQTFRTIFTKMDFVERIRSVRYRGECPRPLTKLERLLINSFYLRFSRRARLEGIRMATAIGATWAHKYYPEIPEKERKVKRCFEWVNPKGAGYLHMGLHDAREDEDLWKTLRQLTGLEDLAATRQWIQTYIRNGSQFVLEEESELVNGAFLRWSEVARQAGLLSSTKFKGVQADGTLLWTLSNGLPLRLRAEDLSEEDDIWRWFVELSRTNLPEAEEVEMEDSDPWKDDTWKKEAGTMFTQEFDVHACAVGERPGIPEAYKAAGLIFFTRDEMGAPARVLLGIEERKIAPHTFGIGSGRGKKAVIVFPQGKREDDDDGYVKTAYREFNEETGDPTGLGKFLIGNVEEFVPKPAYFEEAKMAVVFCEVPAEYADIPVRSVIRRPLRGVWCDVKELKRILSKADSEEMNTELGSYPLFPMARSFFGTYAGQRWLLTRVKDEEENKVEALKEPEDFWGDASGEAGDGADNNKSWGSWQDDKNKSWDNWKTKTEETSKSWSSWNRQDNKGSKNWWEDKDDSGKQNDPFDAFDPDDPWGDKKRSAEASSSGAKAEEEPEPKRRKVETQEEMDEEEAAALAAFRADADIDDMEDEAGAADGGSASSVAGVKAEALDVSSAPLRSGPLGADGADAAEDGDEEAPKLGAWRTAPKGEEGAKAWNEWIRWEKNSEPGVFIYRNTETLEETKDPPPILQEAGWELAGEMYFNKVTGDMQQEPPPIP
eukprot:TRINITY_DN55247_c0_g1_i1.p1 TRINITY_DN55247_c0_g1~~TRINITY_DN55247_c0_g1_i1.p1  ORF type:complete len:1059 (-),score=278.06 TRINITY_DN55247_c0_g1_i1:217-3393(-)